MTCWVAHFVDGTDGLTHRVEDYYGAKMNGPHPETAFTRCGQVVTWDGVRASAGTYVPTSIALTCVRCVGGARDVRHSARFELKNMMFAEVYGLLPSKPLGPHAKDDVALSLALFSPHSILRRCARLAAVFYSKAMEARRA